MTHPYPGPMLWEMPTREPTPLPGWARAVSSRREALGLTRSDLARAANVGRATIYSVEHGHPYVTDRTRARVLEALEELEASIRP